MYLFLLAKTMKNVMQTSQDRCAQKLTVQEKVQWAVLPPVNWTIQLVKTNLGSSNFQWSYKISLSHNRHHGI